MLFPLVMFLAACQPRTESGQQTAEEPNFLSEAMPDFAGSYVYELPDEAGSGALVVEAPDNDRIAFQLELVAGPPAYNQGFMEGVARIDGNRALYSTSEFTGEACELQFVFEKDRVVVETLKGTSPDCGFGNNVRADGTYIRK